VRDKERVHKLVAEARINPTGPRKMPIQTGYEPHAGTRGAVLRRDDDASGRRVSIGRQGRVITPSKALLLS
jgi:hypothetical protein